MAKQIGTSRKTLYIHNKFRFQIDENDELACWTIICRQHYIDRMREGIKDIVHKYWLAHARVSLNARDLIRQRVSRNEYETHAKHIMEMSQVQLFNEFKDDYRGISMSITKFGIIFSIVFIAGKFVRSAIPHTHLEAADNFNSLPLTIICLNICLLYSIEQ